mmetsp:Transcript_33622/g.104133  ORF Transcript_33622/g.104133 Transcript_33622/m.104133 type:complete len:148 (+) Transcript_33622:274-717(+)
MASFEASSKWRGARPGYVFTTREEGTGYYADPLSAPARRDAGGGDDDERKRRKKEKKKRKREKKREKRERKERRKKASEKKKKKRKRSDSSSSDSSDSSSGSDGSDVVRSAISGKRIKMRVEKSADDKAQEEGRKALLRHMNSVSGR